MPCVCFKTKSFVVKLSFSTFTYLIDKKFFNLDIVPTLKYLCFFGTTKVRKSKLEKLLYCIKKKDKTNYEYLRKIQ